MAASEAQAIEQAMELEALQSIMMDDLQEVDPAEAPSGWRPAGGVYRTVLAPQLDAGAAAGDVPPRLELLWAHTPGYPDEPPLVKARPLAGLSDAAVAGLQAALDAAAAEGAGAPVIFTLMELAQEWVTARGAEAATPADDPAAALRRARDAEEARLAELRRLGTPVTPDSFAEWRARFEAERALAAAGVGAGGGGAAAASGAPRLTGRQWFLQQEAANLQVVEVAQGEGEDEEESDEEGGSGGGSDGALDEEDDDDDELLDELLAARGT